MPLLMALAMFAMDISGILSKTSTVPNPATTTETLAVPDFAPAAHTTLTLVANQDPVYFAVSTTLALPASTLTVAVAAVSVPSVTRTQRKFCAPCCAILATCVPRSLVRATRSPKFCLNPA